MAFFPPVPDETAFTAGTSTFTPVGGVWNDSLPAITTGQEATLRITERRAAHVNLRSEAGVEQGTAAAPVRIDPTGTTTQPVSGTVTVTGPLAVTEANLDASIGTPGSAAPAKAQEVGGTDGTNLRTLLTDTTGRLKVLLYDASGNALVVASGNLQTIDASDGPVTPGTVAGKSSLAGGQFNTSAPTLTTGQQGALQLDSSGNLKIAGSITATNPSVGTNLATSPTSDTLVGGQYNATPPAPTSGQMVALQTNQFGQLLIALSSGMIQPVRTVTAATDTATINDFLVRCNAASNAITETLPTGLTSAQTMLIVVEKVDSSANTVTVSGSMDGVSSIVLNQQWQKVVLQWSGAAWDIIGGDFQNAALINPNLAIGTATIEGASTAAALNLVGGTTIGSDPRIMIAGRAAATSADSILYDSDTSLFRNTAGSANFAAFSSAGLSLPLPLIGTMGGYAAFTPTFSGTGSMTVVGAGGVSAFNWIRIGPTVFFEFLEIVTTGGTASNGINISLPIASVAGSPTMPISLVISVNSGATYASAVSFIGPGAAAIQCFQNQVAGAYPNYPLGASVVVIAGSGNYRVA